MIEDDRVATKDARFFFGDVNQVREMIANGALAIFIESRGEPHGPAIGQRTETSVDVIKARVDQLDGNDQATEDVRDRPMGIDVGAEFVTTEKRIAGKERVTLAFEV